METKKEAFLLIILSTFFICLGQILWKIGLEKGSSWTGFFNLYLILGFIFYGFSAVTIVVAFKFGELSVLYPILATSYIWIGLFSPLIFENDVMNVYKWAGIGIIIIGVCLMGRGSRK